MDLVRGEMVEEEVVIEGEEEVEEEVVIEEGTGDPVKGMVKVRGSRSWLPRCFKFRVKGSTWM